MANEPSWDDIFASQPGEIRPPASEGARVQSRRDARNAVSPGKKPPRNSQPRDSRGGRGPRRRRKLAWLWVLLSIVLVVGVGVTYAWSNFQPQIKHVLGWEEPNDFTGAGTGHVVVTIKNGQIGQDVAHTLADAGVTKTFASFYDLLLKQSPQVSFHPGSYSLKKQMSAKSALAAIEDPKNKVVTQVVLPEGITVKGVISRLAAISQATGITKDQLTAAAADYKSFGLPAQAPSLEGYLFPDTYSLDPGITAHGIFQVMVD
ncbi:MAG: endolytic transglycosylase MltG, partial [Lacisediminihabitans sp.]